MRSLLEGGKAPSTIDVSMVKHMKQYITTKINVRGLPEFNDVIVPAFLILCPNQEHSDIFLDFCSYFQRYHLPHLIQDVSLDSPLLYSNLPTSFPPPVVAAAKLITKRTVTIRNPERKKHMNWGNWNQWISTGLYAKQGQLVTMTVPKSLKGKFGIQLGVHTDHLYEKNLKKRLNGGKVNRPAYIDQYYEKKIIKEKTRILTPYGGLIYISVRRYNKLGDFDLDFENVLESPRFIYGESDNESWQESFADSEAPMVELEVPGIIFTIPKSNIEKLKPDMEKLAQLWKNIMDTYNDLLGYVIPAPQRYTSDVEISIGGEHAGYPMMCSGIEGCSYVWDMTNKTGINTGQVNSGTAWGVYHEIGHNCQESRWTPSGLGEVTNNIMAEYVNEKLFNFKPESSDTTKIEEFRKGGKKLDDLGPWGYLNIFMIVVDECGWDTYKRFFRYYNEKMPNTLSPNTNENKFSTIARVLSLSCNKNLVPYFQWWKWPILNDTVEATKSLPAWENVEQMLDSSVKKCTGNHVRWYKDCCNEENPCGEGEGHCANNDECIAGMRCGNKNCDISTLTFTQQDNCCSASVLCDGGEICPPDL